MDGEIIAENWLHFFFLTDISLPSGNKNTYCVENWSLRRTWRHHFRDRCCIRGFPSGSVVKKKKKKKHLPMQETQVRSLDQEDSLEEGMATHSSIFAWRIRGQRSLAGCSPGGSCRHDDYTTRSVLYWGTWGLPVILCVGQALAPVPGTQEAMLEVRRPTFLLKHPVILAFHKIQWMFLTIKAKISLEVNTSTPSFHSERMKPIAIPQMGGAEKASW